VWPAAIPIKSYIGSAPYNTLRPRRTQGSIADYTGKPHMLTIESGSNLQITYKRENTKL